jgi:maltose-binding protein MalE
MKRLIGLVLAVSVLMWGAADSRLLAHETHKDKVHVSVIDEKTKKVSSMEFKVTSKTKVLRGDKVVKFADAKIVKDERIAVTVNHDDSMTDATVIRLAAPAAK